MARKKLKKMLCLTPEHDVWLENEKEETGLTRSSVIRMILNKLVTGELKYR